MDELRAKNIITVVFIIAAVFAFLIFSGTIKVGKDANKVKGKISVWGTIPYNDIKPFIDQARTTDIEVSYTVKDRETYEQELVSAIAAGEGPDLFIMPHEQLLKNADKVLILPYTSFPKATYLSTYIQESRLFLTPSGVVAIPFFVDPIVLYYNKQLIHSSFLVGYPKTWEEFARYAQEITVKDPYGNIQVAGAAFGSFDNVREAKSILSLLFLQQGNPIVGDDPQTGKKRPVITATKEYSDAAKNALEFYSSFQDVQNSHYSWNESLMDSRDQFIAGTLGLYFDRMSRVADIRRRNPNLDFGVALVPQLSETSVKKTFGELYGVAVSKHTKNKSAAIIIASRLTGKDIVSKLTESLHVAPARNDLLRNKPDDAVRTLAFQSAIISDGWFDTDPEKTERLMRNLVRSVNAKSTTVFTALRNFSADLAEVLDHTINKVIKGRLDS